MTQLWSGVAVALATLFEDDGTLAATATADHAAALLAAGVKAVVVNGSTGEAAALTDEERLEVVAAVRAACPGVPVFAGASGEWHGAALARARGAVAAGADGLLVAPPRSAADPVGFYARLTEELPDVTVLAYHFPGTAGGEIPVEVLPSLPVAGLKDSSGDAERLLHALEWGRPTYVGSAMLLQYAGVLGAAGAILALANVAPEDCAAAWAGDGAAQCRLLAPHTASAVQFPRGLKLEMARRFGTPPAARLG